MTLGALPLGLPGLLANRYHLLGPVGRGAIAEVVRARDEATGREVALKILYPHLRESAAVVERFRREVEIVRRISHPNVLGIHDVIESDGHLFLVMDFYDGGDLADRLAAKRRLDAPALRRLGEQLCGALAAAHRAGVVHRDVKPSNVLCGPRLELDVRLCDFGLARTADLSGLTTANAVLGTPEYMAPEVVTDGHADPRSDLYSLGVVLFEAATGRLPFYGDSPYQLMRQHIDIEAPRARTLAADLPPAIDEAIARALAKDPLDRFATAEDLARALAAEPGGSSIPSSGTSSAALVPRRSAPAARRTCRHCGGWVVDVAAVCADCGTPVLRLERERRGFSVLVTGPGKAADKLDAWKHVALYKILDELPAGSVPKGRGRRRAPRVPFYVAKDLTKTSATGLVQRLEAVGLDSSMDQGSALARRGMAKKTWRMAKRYGAGLGALLYGANSFFRFLPSLREVAPGWEVLLVSAPFVLIALGFGGTYVLSARRSRRPLVADVVGPGGRDDPTLQVAAVLPRLQSRQDRRLLGHILERLADVEAFGRGEAVAGLAGRSARVADALAALDVRRDFDASVSRDAPRALEELRREETSRAVLRADLLRAASRLDDLCLAITRANALGASDEVAQLAREIQDLALAVDAEEELGALLGGAR